MTEQDLDMVPSSDHYSGDYLRFGRVFSFAHQVNGVLAFKSAETVLEVGTGGGTVSGALRSAGLSVTTLDIQADLGPDVRASVAALPFADGAFDVVLCCQVLEHLPWESFADSCSELWRACRAGLVLSLPDPTPYYEVRLQLPRLPKVSWAGTRRAPVSEQWRQERWQSSGHYWEIGYPRTTLRSITRTLRETTAISPLTWRVPEKPYHRFFLLPREPLREDWTCPA